MVESVGNLDSTYINIINSILTQESQPLDRLESKQEDIAELTSAYSKLETLLNSLQNSLQNLISTDANYGLKLGKTPVISDTGDYTVLTASASSYATAASYEIDNILLAQEHQVISDKQVYSTQDLELSGTILIGGAETSSLSTTATVADTVTAFATSEVDEGKIELGSGNYYVETRNDAEKGWQFRLVDEDGKAISIEPTDGTETYTTSWQSIPTGGGDYDTGRGLTITFGANSGSYVEANRTLGNAAELDYTAKGASIEISEDDSLIDIASLINAAEYADGDGVIATVIDNQLMLKAENTGEDYLVRAEDLTGNVLESLGLLNGDGSFKTVQQTARNASFTVDGISIERNSNIGLNDVISGATINLAADAEGRNATLKINDDTSDARAAIDAFITDFNAVAAYIEEQSAITEVEDDNGKKSYERGALTSETTFQDLRTNLMTKFFEISSNDGLFDSLREVGIELNDSLMIEVADEDLLNDALTNNMSDVSSLFDDIFRDMDTQLERFTTNDGYMDIAPGWLRNPHK